MSVRPDPLSREPRRAAARRLGSLLRSIGSAISFASPRDARKVIAGSWLGRRFADNPKYFLRHLARQRPELDLVWIGDPSIRDGVANEPGIRFVPIGGARARWEMLTAGTVLLTHGLADLGESSCLGGARRVYLGHGLAIKRMGHVDGTRRSVLQRLMRYIVGAHARCTDFIASSEAHRDKILAEFGSIGSREARIHLYGQPRVDYLMAGAGDAEEGRARELILRKLGLPDGSRIVLYLPTFRDSGAEVRSFIRAEPAESAAIEHQLARLGAVLLEKSHFVDLEREREGGTGGNSRVRSLAGANWIDTQELLLAADVLVTDYSGCFVDYLLLDRPIIHYAYDRREYETADRGLYFNLDDVAGGDIVATHAELLASMSDALVHGPSHGADRRREVRARLVSCEGGDSCIRLESTLFPR